MLVLRVRALVEVELSTTHLPNADGQVGELSVVQALRIVEPWAAAVSASDGERSVRCVGVRGVSAAYVRHES